MICNHLASSDGVAGIIVDAKNGISNKIMGGHIESIGEYGTGRGQTTPASRAGSGIKINSAKDFAIGGCLSIGACSDHGVDVGTAVERFLASGIQFFPCNTGTNGGGVSIVINGTTTMAVLNGIMSPDIGTQPFSLWTNSPNTVVIGCAMGGVSQAAGWPYPAVTGLLRNWGSNLPT